MVVCLEDSNSLKLPIARGGGEITCHAVLMMEEGPPQAVLQGQPANRS